MDVLFDSPVAQAIRESGKLNELIQLDLDTSHGGIAWWAGYDIDLDTRICLSDYTLSVSAAVKENLADAAASLALYLERKNTEDNWVHLRMSRGRGKTDS